jgi:hypothetical protein
VTAPKVLLDLVEAGVQLSVEGGKLRYGARIGAVTPELRTRAGNVRGTLIALVKSGAVLPHDREAWPTGERAAADERAGKIEFELGLDWEVARREAEHAVRLEHTRGFLDRAKLVVTPDAVAVASDRPGSGPRQGP